MAMTFQEAWEAERRAKCPEGCGNAKTSMWPRQVSELTGRWVHVLGYANGVRQDLECTAPTERQFTEQVWSRMEAAEARATAAQNRITQLESERDRLRAALTRISTEHINYGDPTIGNEPYGIGVVDGHRCAAHIARTALAGTQSRQGEKES